MDSSADSYSSDVEELDILSNGIERLGKIKSLKTCKSGKKIWVVLDESVSDGFSK